MRSRGVFWILPGTVSDALGGRLVERSAVKDPRPVREGMHGVDLALFGRQPERFGRDAEKLRRLAQVQPRFDSVGLGSIDRNLVM